jgi:hypothetical protein
MADECSICYEVINAKIDSVITQCEHCFHTSCLMKNVVINGYACPLCRRALGKEDNEDNDADDDSITTTELYPLNHNSSISEGSRIIMGEVTSRNISPPLVNVLPVIVKPTPAFITSKLVEQGITMEYLVKALLKDHDEYDEEESEFINIDDDLFGYLRIIISNCTQ